MIISNIFTTPTKHVTLSNTLESYMDIDCERALLELMRDTETEYFNITREHTISMYYGTKDHNTEILTEAVNTYINKVIEFFKKLIASFTEFFKKAWTYLMSYIGDFDKFILKYKSVLEKIEPDFKIDLYNYTFDSNIPNVDPIYELVASFNTDIHNLNNMEYSSLQKERREYLNIENFNKIRAIVLNRHDEIRGENYLSEIRKVFRDGETDPSTVYINNNKLRRIISDYDKLKKTLNDAKKEFNQIQSLLGNLKKFFESGTSVYYRNNTKTIGSNKITLNGTKMSTMDEKVENDYDELYLKKLNSFYSFKFEQSKLLSVLVTNVYYEKINALKEALHAYKDIIRNAMFTKKDSINKEGNNNDKHK